MLLCGLLRACDFPDIFWLLVNRAFDFPDTCWRWVSDLFQGPSEIGFAVSGRGLRLLKVRFVG